MTGSSDGTRATRPPRECPSPAWFLSCAISTISISLWVRSGGLGEQAGELGVDELEGGVGVVEAGAEEFGVFGGGGLLVAEPVVPGRRGPPRRW